jgi:hypothetical protein
MSDTDKAGTSGLSQRTQLIVAGVLGGALVVVLLVRYGWGSASTAGPQAAAQHPAANTSSGPEAAALAVLQAQVREVELTQPPKVVFITRDPFALTDKLRAVVGRGENPAGPGPNPPEGVSPETIRQQAAALKLKGISGEAQDRVAFVNDRIVRAADRIEGFSVVEILERELLVEKQGIRVTLKLAEPGSGPKKPEQPPAPQKPEEPPAPQKPEEAPAPKPPARVD